MFNKFTAIIRKWASLPFEDVRNILSWLDIEKSKVELNNSSLLIGAACDETGKPVTYATIENVFVVNDYAFRPQLADEAAGIAGDALDASIVREAQRRGIGKVLLVIPDEAPSQPDEKWFRVAERKVPETVTVTCHDEQGHPYTYPITLPNQRILR